MWWNRDVLYFYFLALIVISTFRREYRIIEKERGSSIFVWSSTKWKTYTVGMTGRVKDIWLYPTMQVQYIISYSENWQPVRKRAYKYGVVCVCINALQNIPIIQTLCTKWNMLACRRNRGERNVHWIKWVQTI